MNPDDLLRQIIDKDSEPAFRALFDMQYERFYRVALFFVEDEDLAKDVVLDVFAHLWENRHKMIIPKDFRHYSFTMVKNAAINAWKREHRQESEELDRAEEAQIGDTPESALEQSELFETYERLLDSLPERCREVFCRVKEDGQSYAEVAEAMNISVKTVDAQLQKALAHLRAGLKQYQNSGSGNHFMMIFL